jgi:hypothetical protein
MAKFVLAYRTPDEYVPFQPDTVSSWTAWFDSMGADLINAGQPVVEARQIGDCGPGQRLGGYSVVTADDFEAALRLAKGCPGLDHGFGVEVGELAEVDVRQA